MKYCSSRCKELHKSSCCREVSVRRCARCGRYLPWEGLQKRYCGRVCRSSQGLHKGVRIRRCDWCNKSYEYKDVRSRYCSKRCGKSGRRGLSSSIEYGECINCFRVTINRKYCSRRCKESLKVKGVRRHLPMLLERDNHECQLRIKCDGPLPADRRLIEVDHIIPRSKGGSDALENLQIACRQCNLAKGSSVLRGMI